MTSTFSYISFFLTPILAYCIYRIFKFFNNVRIIGKAIVQFPMEKKHWIWGHINLFPGANEEGLKFWQKMVDKYPKGFAFWAISWYRPCLNIHHPDTVKCILKTTEPKSTSQGGYRYGLDWIGNGLLLSSGERWQRNRKLLTPAFHHDNLVKFLKVKNRCAEVFVEKLSGYAEKEESIEIMGNLSALTLDIILRCAFSYENDIQQVGGHHPYMQAVEELGNLWLERSVKPWLMFDFIYKFTNDSRKFTKLCRYVHSFSDEIINKRKEQHEKRNDDVSEGPNDILDVLLKARDEDGVGLSREEIRAEVNTILFAGHDTSAVALSWTLYSLAQNPQHQKRCQEEIDDLFDGKQNEDISSEDLQKLSFLTCCIKESMRMHSPVPLIERELTNPLIIDGKQCPTGSVVSTIIYNVHHNGAVWKDHMKFDPERFFPENIEEMDPFAFIPFSTGPRNCIGQHFAMNEMKIILSKVLRKFTFSLDPAHSTKRKFGLVMKTEAGMFMNVKQRSFQ